MSQFKECKLSRMSVNAECYLSQLHPCPLLTKRINRIPGTAVCSTH
ncbi:hypothetical protein MKleb_5903 (plasmid) [Klebsiella sp. PL-2018]|nr:hypothetical protein MKleb_5828 [Klebsiella sp. PL-2018]QXD01404.1 hypothetical protein MKleb_5903 [Klebsiella sp. PL-2018]